ncbi:MAG: FHA domain-containing protein, partial [Polyangiales bacterium]
MSPHQTRESREGFVLEIRRGQGEPRFLRLPRGADLQPTSIGARGDFRVDADGVLDVHAFVYFDGETLFVQSAETATPVRVNGRAATTEWTRVDPPSTLAFGDARVVFCPASQASAVSAPTPARPAAGARVRPPSNVREMEDLPTIADVPPPGDFEEVVTERVKAPDEDATHSIPIPGGRHVPEPPPEHPDDETTRALPLPAIVAPVARPAPPAVVIAPEVTTKIATGGPIAAPPQAPKTVEKAKPLDQLKAQWKEASLP